VAEVELILATAEALLALGLSDLTVRINDRRLLVAMAEHCGFAPAAFESVFIGLDKLDKIGPSGVRAELESAGHPAMAVAALMTLLDEPALGKGQVDDVLRALPIDREAAPAAALRAVIRAVTQASAGRYALALDPTLVRGMSYYTGQIFEISYKDHPASIAGGGRYDRLIGRILGRDVPACGFSIGFERIIAILLDLRHTVAAPVRRLALIFDRDRDDLAEVVSTAQRLRADGHLVSLESRSKRLSRQLDDLAAQGVGGYLIFGESEVRPLGSGGEPS
jgi:histidyl-tRNA synthetase